jgi:hypothetical protein
VDEIGSPHDEVFMYERGGRGNILTGRYTYGTSGRAAPFEKKKHGHGSSSSPRVREGSFGIRAFLPKMQSTFLFGRLLCGVALSKRRDMSLNLKR